MTLNPISHLYFRIKVKSINVLLVINLPIWFLKILYCTSDVAVLVHWIVCFELKWSHNSFSEVAMWLQLLMHVAGASKLLWKWAKKCLFFTFWLLLMWTRSQPPSTRDPGPALVPRTRESVPVPLISLHCTGIGVDQKSIESHPPFKQKMPAWLMCTVPEWPAIHCTIYISNTFLLIEKLSLYNLISGHQILIFCLLKLGHLSFFLTLRLTVEHFLCQRNALNQTLLKIFSASQHFIFIIFMSNIFCGA